MKIKRYEGQYVHEVIAQIREELGPDAVVLHTRWRNPAGIKKLLGKPQVEVWAGTREDVDDAEAAEPAAARLVALRQALEANDPVPAAAVEVAAGAVVALNGAAKALNGHGAAKALNGHAGAVAVAEPPALPELDLEALVNAAHDELSLSGQTPPPTDDDGPDDSVSEDLTVALLSEFNQALSRLEGKVDDLATRQQRPATVTDDSPRLRALVESGVERDVAVQVVAAADDRTVTEVLLDAFQCPPAIDWTGGPKVIAVVGPSGVGKTTSLAKLAGHLAIGRGARVLLASADSQRVGTYEQVKALGQLMELPTCAVRSAAEAQTRLPMMRQGHDVILVDTAACTPQAPESWDRLLDTLIACEPDAIFAVLPASMRPRDAARHIDTFRRVLPLEGVIVTKLDEAADPGLLVDLAWRCLIPIGYLGTGAGIPGDLEVATPELLLRRVWSAQTRESHEE